MKILIVVDCPDWAINNLVGSIVKYNDRHKFFIVYAHPRNVAPAVQEVQNILREHTIDVWHAQYWNSGWQLAELCKELREIPGIVTHHNHKHLKKKDWSEYFAASIVPTNYGAQQLTPSEIPVYKIPHGLDLDEFSYIEKRDDDEKSVGYVGRILPHKNIHKVCAGAKNLGYKVIGSGYIDKPKYFQDEVQQYLKDETLDFQGGVGRGQMNSWEAKNRLYERMSVFVMYSSSEYETGTLPLLEAMARGVPVLATEQGMARDLIKDGDNGVLFNDDNFEQKLKMVMEDKDLQEAMRRKARKTMTQYSEEKMAILYDYAYSNIRHGLQKRISVILPTCNRADTLGEILQSIENQTYKNIELIIIDDGDDNTEHVVKEFRNQSSLSIKYIKQENPKYGLAEARNRGIIEARGKLLVFVDDRLKIDENAVMQFVENTDSKQWNFGQKQVKGKPSNKRTFIENFSAVHKEDVASIGMFNERIEWYGGMSQDIRVKCGEVGINHKYVEEAIAHAIRHAPKMKKPEDIWKSKLLLWKLYT